MVKYIILQKQDPRKQIYRFSATPIKVPTRTFALPGKLILAFTSKKKFQVANKKEKITHKTSNYITTIYIKTLLKN